MVEKDSAEMALDDILGEIESQSFALNEHFSQQDFGDQSKTEIVVQDPPTQIVAPEGGNSFTAAGKKSYTILAQIGKGGMGEILRTRESIKREVATKRALSTDKGSVKRFILEALVTAHLCHPNIPPVYDLQADSEGNPYFTMLFVRGEPLTDRIKNTLTGMDGEYKLSKKLRDFRGISDGMAFAHSVGVIHRDLKPDNVMLGKHGEVLVMDWGLAKILNDNFAEIFKEVIGSQNTQLTMAGMAMGTISYMPPEQASGRIDLIDQRADIYALGGILHFMLTGRPALNLDKYRQGIKGINFPKALVAIESGNIDIEEKLIDDRDLTNIIAKCLARRREDRYPNVESLNEDIDAYLEGRMLSTEEYLRDASEVISRGERSESALIRLGKAREIDPDSPGAYFAEGQLYIKNKEGKKAIRAFINMYKAIKRRTKKSNARALFYAGQAARFVKNKKHQALRFYKYCAEAGELTGHDKFSFLSQALNKFYKNDIGSAIESLQNAEKNDANFAETHIWLACIHADFFLKETIEGLGDFSGKIPEKFIDIDKAINHFDKAIQFSDEENKIKYLSIKSFALLKAKRVEDAKKTIDDSVNAALESHYGDLLQKLFIYQKLGEWKNVIKYCDSLMFILGKKTHHLLYNKGVAYEKTDDFENAITHYLESVELATSDKDKSDCLRNIGAIFRSMGNFEEAIKNYKRAIKFNPTYAKAFNDLADCYYEMGDHTSAIENCNRAVKEKPKYGLAFLTRGLAYFARWEQERIVSDLRDAHNDFRKALKLDLTENFSGMATQYLWKTLTNIGDYFMENGKYDDVIKTYETASRLEHSSEIAHLEVLKKEAEKKSKKD